VKTKAFRVQPDRIELEQVEALIAHPGWRLVEERIDSTIEQIARSLRTCAAGELESFQARIQQLEQVKQIPGQLAREIQARC
jgi:DNA segregation ATPase FtsK/SpoIIIE-like protein